ncbi:MULTISPECIES: (2Fe-2S) ferredoxin domain-containing protein [Dethiosulfovibrio]|jgi:NADP-reducing hydrogenase subunit HndB|uniref:(2Fe-2S) ferredoxin domain-containing protein n=2 Tax=Dethiosulfovibrio TaxID=47054 RepID=A0ABS9EK31_9BACT|nr:MULTISPECIES: (2Fe-2S) ferredoxin domain-containing protein [Dethiosulfovibrio]MCF4113089.1 (2Fe-2S) ferredoxin domain-containing protein [Dethiosulfovibrio russensis]MCF4141553.1 (2Fe-2S) ferredoxin domain-containing protein [Dethiosulfovibrio marinus]MCF4144510.1 (2Fe-2S) ferredoxin domain-containing protein [Dethiosulfovibrio acidaminovorans]MEA3284406.1 (2Fe-2S) ferredoxin domain-containing protein [Synergistota bacterium]
MAKIKSLDELRRIKTSASDLTAARSSNAVKVIVGMGTCGIAAGAREVMDAVLKEIEKRGLKEVSVQTTGCIGMCQEEPLLDVIYPNKGRITYGRVTPEDVPRIVSEHVVNGRIVEDLVIARVDD